MYSVKAIPRWAKICGLLCLSLLSPSLLAATVTLVGDNFNLSYNDLQPGLAIYGVPVYGPGTNTISFNQVGFTASASGDTAPFNSQSTASTIEITLTRNSPTFNFESLNLFEFGNYTLNGPLAEVSLTGSMAVNGLHFGLFPILDPVAQITPIGSLSTNDGLAHNWFGSSFADLTAPGFGAGGPGTDSWSDEDTIVVNINNILGANTTQAGTLAFIQKLSASDAVQLGVNGAPATPVPVPAAIWLLGSGLLGLLGVARRRRVS